jgi:hypothetical protein
MRPSSSARKRYVATLLRNPLSKSINGCNCTEYRRTGSPVFSYTNASKGCVRSFTWDHSTCTHAQCVFYPLVSAHFLYAERTKAAHTSPFILLDWWSRLLHWRSREPDSMTLFLPCEGACGSKPRSHCDSPRGGQVPHRQEADAAPQAHGRSHGTRVANVPYRVDEQRGEMKLEIPLPCEARSPL